MAFAGSVGILIFVGALTTTNILGSNLRDFDSPCRYNSFGAVTPYVHNRSALLNQIFLVFFTLIDCYMLQCSFIN